MWFVVVPDILVPLDIQTVEVVIFDESLLLFFVFTVLQALHDCQLHLHGDVDWQHRLQQVLLQTQHTQAFIGALYTCFSFNTINSIEIFSISVPVSSSMVLL